MIPKVKVKISRSKTFELRQSGWVGKILMRPNGLSISNMAFWLMSQDGHICHFSKK